MFFYEIIQKIMDEKGLKIPDIARICGLTDGTIRSMIARQSKSVTLEVAFKLSSGLGVSLEQLNGEDSISDQSENCSRLAGTALSNQSQLRIIEKLSNLTERQLESIEKRVDIYIEDNEISEIQVLSLQKKKAI